MGIYVPAPPLVRVDQANAWTAGLQDMSGAASFKVPVAAGAAPTAQGDLRFDSTQIRAVLGGLGSLTGAIPRVLSAQFSSSDTMDAGTVGTTETAFATTFTIKANTLIANKGFLVLSIFENTTPGTAVSVLLKGRFQKTGPINVYFYTQATVNTIGASSTRGFGLWTIIQGTAAAGAAASVEAGVTAPFGQIAQNSVAQPVTVDTTSDQVIQFTNTFGGSTAGNIVRLRQLWVVELN